MIAEVQPKGKITEIFLEHRQRHSIGRTETQEAVAGSVLGPLLSRLGKDGPEISDVR